MAKKIANRVLEDINSYCAETYDGGFRNHLGASLIGHDCSRYLWYTFRWVKHIKHSGQQQRLFNRGHREEERFIEWLEGIGFTVHAHNKETGEQWRVSDVGGHFGGSLDGIAYFPESYGIKEPILLEFKTNGYKTYPKLLKDGMQRAKPQHFAQTSVYGSNENYNFRYVLYLNINKNDDQIHCELVQLNHNLGKQMIAKAERIITSQVEPERYCNNITMQPCVWCDMKNICFNSEQAEKNCRSCKFAKPVDNGKWMCTGYNDLIPDDFIKTGCNNWSSIVGN